LSTNYAALKKLILTFSVIVADHYNECGQKQIIGLIFADFRQRSAAFGHQKPKFAAV